MAIASAKACRGPPAGQRWKTIASSPSDPGARGWLQPGRYWVPYNVYNTGISVCLRQATIPRRSRSQCPAKRPFRGKASSIRTDTGDAQGPLIPLGPYPSLMLYRGTWLVGMYYYMVRRVKPPGALFSPTRTHGYSERESAPGSSPDSSQPFSINRVTARRYGWDHDFKLIRDAAGPTAALSDMIFWRARIQNLKSHDGSLSLPPFRVIPPWGEVAGYPRSRTELQHTP